MLYKDKLVETYPVRLRLVVCSIILFISLSAYIFPRFLETGLKNIDKKNNDFEAIDVPPPTSQVEIIKPPPRPSVPIASEDEDFDMEISIEDTDVDNFEEWEPPSFSNDEEIFESFQVSNEPKPRKGFEVGKFAVYPELAKEAGIEGTVIIAAFINKKGIPKNIYIVKGVHESLDRAAFDAVEKSRWVPVKNQGKRIGVWINIPVSFKLQ